MVELPHVTQEEASIPAVEQGCRHGKRSGPASHFPGTVGKYIVEFYRDSPLVEQALEVMVESYDKLGLTKLKEDTYQVLKLNFPQNNKF